MAAVPQTTAPLQRIAESPGAAPSAGAAPAGTAAFSLSAAGPVAGAAPDARPLRDARGAAPGESLPEGGNPLPWMVALLQPAGLAAAPADPPPASAATMPPAAPVATAPVLAQLVQKARPQPPPDPGTAAPESGDPGTAFERLLAGAGANPRPPVPSALPPAAGALPPAGAPTADPAAVVPGGGQPTALLAGAPPASLPATPATVGQPLGPPRAAQGPAAAINVGGAPAGLQGLQSAASAAGVAAVTDAPPPLPSADVAGPAVAGADDGPVSAPRTDAPPPLTTLQALTARPVDTAPVMSLQTPVASPGWSDALGDRVAWLVQHDVGQAHLKLNPPQLGPVEVRVHINGDQATVAFTAHNQQAREALEGATQRLRDLLGAQGFVNVQVDVGQQSYQQRPLLHAPYDDAGAAIAAPAAAAPLPTGRLARTLLDAYA
jgi:flagellar hook-length control protein FliK